MFWQLLRRGSCRKCPQCGQSSLFSGHLTPRNSCEVCKLNFQTIRSDDMPAYFTIAIVGHLLLPIIYWSELNFNLSIEAHMAIWLPTTIILTSR